MNSDSVRRESEDDLTLALSQLKPDSRRAIVIRRELARRANKPAFVISCGALLISAGSLLVSIAALL